MLKSIRLHSQIWYCFLRQIVQCKIFMLKAEYMKVILMTVRRKNTVRHLN